MEQKTEHGMESGVVSRITGMRFFPEGLGLLATVVCFGVARCVELPFRRIFPRSLEPEQPRISFLPVQTVMSRFFFAKSC